ncbi:MULTISPECIES: M28 family peptidase [Bacteria]|uniref:M28 family peptidase n=1 Tax=Bacteria TaxID=2 RepID=UPI003C7B0E2F
MTRSIRTACGAVGLVLLILLSWWAVQSVSPPAALPASAPADQFSAERARVHQEQVSREQHPAGSPAADEVRRYVLDQLAEMGVEARVQDSVGATGALGGLAMARVQNVVAEIPGTDSSGRLFLLAHYDSVQVSYGAGDDGAGVSTLLETARALKAGDAPRNDVVLVFTDAEEACLCGAEAFMTSDPLAKDGGVVLNFESRGSSGPAIMFETAKGNAALVNAYADAVRFPVATSFAVEVYRLLPNDTDFSPFRDDGRFTGLNTAYIDGSATYHSPEDRVEYQSIESLQHHGSNALDLARSLGDADLGALSVPSAEDATYFPALGQLVRYPGWAVWPLAILALLTVAGAAVVLVRRRRVSGGRMAAALGLGVLPIVASAAVAQLFWLALTAIRPGYGQLSDPWSPGWYRIAVVALVLTVVITWLALFRRRFGAEALAVGGLAWLAAIGVVMAAATPGGSYLAAIPALAGGVAMLLQTLPRGGVVAQLLSGVVAVIVLAPTVALFFPAMGLERGAAAALFASFLAIALVPILELLFPDAAPRSRRIRRAVPGVAGLAAAMLATGIGLSVDRFDAAHPVPVEMMYAMDADTGKASWVRPGGDPTGWSDGMVDRVANLSDEFGVLKDRDDMVGDAPAADLRAPEVTVLSEKTVDGNRELTLRITPQRAGRLVYLEAKEGQVLAATARGREVPTDGGPFSLLFHAPPRDGLDVTLTVAGDGPLQLRLMDGSDGLAGLPGFVPRPEGVGIMGSHTSELAVVARTVTL